MPIHGRTTFLNAGEHFPDRTQFLPITARPVLFGTLSPQYLVLIGDLVKWMKAVSMVAWFLKEPIWIDKE
jgi:hypothetical protein